VTQPLVVIGAGGFGREVVDVVAEINLEWAATDRGFEVLGFLDDGHPDLDLLAEYKLEHLGPVATLHDMPADVGYVIGIGSPAVKARIDRQLIDRPAPVLVHPSATIARSVALGPGTIICSHVSITNHIALGRHVHVNLNCTIGHDTTLGDYVTASPLCAISGNVHAEAGVFLGTGAVINPGVTLGEGAVVGSGAAVIKDVVAGTTVVGVPAKPRG
jgi:sugar O-acyltransferase (sialic acid O-acetyltransferase NeuD family)